MKNFAIFFFFLFFIQRISFCQHNIPQKNLLTDELPFQIHFAGSGNIYITGSISTFVSDEAYLAKHDSTGTFLWSKMAGGNSYDYFRKAIESDNSVISAGSTNSFGQSRNFYIASFDQAGDSIWTMVLGGQHYDQLMDIAFNGKTILSGGYSNSFGSLSNNDILLINLDSSGYPLRAKSIEAPGEDILHSIKADNDGGYIISGSTDSYGSGLKDAFILKTDSSGSLIWLSCIGGTDHEDVLDIIVKDNFYYATGYTRSINGGQDLWIIKIDQNGKMVWNKIVDFGLFEKGNKIFLKDGSIYICGYMQSMTGSTDDIFVLKIDEQGQNITAKNFPLSSGQFGNFVGIFNNRFLASGFETSDGTMEIFEINDSLISCNSSNLDFDTTSLPIFDTTYSFVEHLVPVDSLFVLRGGFAGDYGNEAVSIERCLLPTYIQDPQNQKEIMVLANPGNGVFTVNLDNKLSGEYFLTILSVSGASIFSEKLVNSQNFIDLSGNSSGIYLLKITGPGILLTEKIIVCDL